MFMNDKLSGMKFSSSPFNMISWTSMVMAMDEKEFYVDQICLNIRIAHLAY